jgi:antitoxin FitA
MRNACDMVARMPHVQIRNVPASLHRTLKARAAQAGMSLSEYLLAEIRESARTPTVEELVERVRSRRLIHSRKPAADLIREEREAREQRVS